MISFSTLVIVLYEYTLTFPDEVNLFWKQKITGATVLFMANRYLVVGLYASYSIWSMLPPSAMNEKVRVELYSLSPGKCSPKLPRRTSS